MKKNQTIKKIVKECVSEMMNVGQPELKGDGKGLEITLTTLDRVIDALVAGRIDAEKAKALVKKIASEDVSKAALAAGGGCRY